MSVDKTKLPSEGSPKSLLALLNFGANTVTSAFVYKHGVVTVLEFGLSNATTVFVKQAHNDDVEVGGTLEMGTGTRLKW